MRRPRRRAVGISATIITLLLGSILTLASPAWAGEERATTAVPQLATKEEPAPPAPAPPSSNASNSFSTFSQTIVAVPPPASPGVATSAAASVITCKLTVQNPHKSTHVPGTINIVTTILCTAAVPALSIRAALYKNGALVRDSGQRDVYNNVVAQNNAAVPCSNGTYQGWGSYGVLFPPGYVPQTGVGSAWGNVPPPITC